jgi:hypothetical protein
MHQNRNHTHEQTIKEPNQRKNHLCMHSDQIIKNPSKYKKETNDKQKPKPNK